MRTIESTKLGTIEFIEENIISFNNGIPGFEEEKHFIICSGGNDSPFAYLQAINNKELTFILANPFVFFSDYKFELDDNIKEELKVERIEDVATWGIVSIINDIKNATINLKAPLIINVREKVGKQYIIQDINYLTDTPLFPQSVIEGGK